MTTTNEALKLVRLKLHALQQCHPHAVLTLALEAEELLEKALAQPEQEPKRIGKASALWGGPVVFDPPLAQPEQEPMAWAVMKDGECLSVRRFEPAATSHADGVQFVPLYTTPPQRKPLTDEEERKACEEWCYSVGLMQKSHGVISINSQVEAVWMAWKARAAHGIKEAA